MSVEKYELDPIEHEIFKSFLTLFVISGLEKVWLERMIDGKWHRVSQYEDGRVYSFPTYYIGEPSEYIDEVIDSFSADL